MSKNSSDQEPMKKSSIDRPRRKPQKKLKIEEEPSMKKEEENYYLKEHEDIRNEYSEFSLSNTIVNILNKVVQSSPCTNIAAKKATMHCLISIAKDLALNEMEVSLWTIYLQRVDCNDIINAFQSDILFAAYASKSYLNENLKPFNVFLEKNNPNFPQEYENWYNAYMNSFKIDSKEINNRFKGYSEPYLGLGEVQIIDYNHCVDDILRIATESSVKEDKELGVIEEKEEDEEESDTNVGVNKNFALKIDKEEKSQIPIFALDAISPQQFEDANKMKSPGSVDFVNSIPRLGEMSDPGLFSEGTPGFQMQSNMSPQFPTLPALSPSFSTVVSPNLSPWLKSSTFNGFPNFNG